MPSGGYLVTQGQYTEAEALHERSYELRIDKLGLRHPTVEVALHQRLYLFYQQVGSM